MSVTEALPWQHKAWAQLVSSHASRSLPHALLFSGMKGTGIRQFARAFAGYVLCQQTAAGQACGQCHACQLLAAGSHPDLKWLSPDKKGGVIKIDQVREVVDFGHGTAQQGGYRVIVVSLAEDMNISAANALLKTLEEPGARMLLMLVSYARVTVLPTIRSRCQQLPMSAPDQAASREWLADKLEQPEQLDLLLEAAPCQPLYGLELVESGGVSHLQALAASLPALIGGKAEPLATAKIWAAADTSDLLAWLYRWLSDARLILAGSGVGSPIARAIAEQWTARAGAEELDGLLDQIIVARRQLAAATNPNQALLLEGLALNLAVAGVSRPRAG